MNKVINDILNECITKLEEYKKELLDDNIYEFYSFYQKSKEEFNKTFLKIMQNILKQKDEEYYKTRNKKEILITHKNKVKTLLTEEGELKISRNRYYSVLDKKPFYYIDSILNLDRKRIFKPFEIKILKHSINKSYKSVEKNFDNKVTCQTAINIAKRNINKIEAIEKEVTKRNIKEIFIEADEDHVHLRNKKNLQVKLIYVHEGYRKNPLTNKNELISPKYFSDIDKNIWKSVKDYILKTYNKNIKIIINSDGANWIKYPIKIFKNTQFFLDKFHIKSSIELISNSKKQKEELYKALRSNKDIRKYEIHKVYIKYDQHLQLLKKCRFYSNRWEYLIFNSDYIDIDNLYSHCSAESHVSHVLSDRMSSRPMAWSLKGAKIMAKYRAFLFNKINFEKLVA